MGRAAHDDALLPLHRAIMADVMVIDRYEWLEAMRCDALHGEEVCYDQELSASLALIRPFLVNSCCRKGRRVRLPVPRRPLLHRHGAEARVMHLPTLQN